MENEEMRTDPERSKYDFKSSAGNRAGRLDLEQIPETVQIDLCVMAIQRTAAALQTPEGRAAIAKAKQAYLLHLEQRKERL